MCACGRRGSPTSYSTFRRLAELRRPQTLSIVSASPQRTALGKSVRLAVVDRAAIDSVPADFTREPSVLDLRAAVHNHGQAGRFGALRGRFVDHTELHPEHL